VSQNPFEMWTCLQYDRIEGTGAKFGPLSEWLRQLFEEVRKALRNLLVVQAREQSFNRLINAIPNLDESRRVVTNRW
jgi:hypothetical protein